MIDKLYSQVWTDSRFDNEMNVVPTLNWGQVVRTTAKSVWIKGRHDTEKWTVQTDGRWKDRFGIKRTFRFELDPLVKFVASKG